MNISNRIIPNNRAITSNRIIMGGTGSKQEEIESDINQYLGEYKIVIGILNLKSILQRNGHQDHILVSYKFKHGIHALVNVILDEFMKHWKHPEMVTRYMVGSRFKRTQTVDMVETVKKELYAAVKLLSMTVPDNAIRIGCDHGNPYSVINANDVRMILPQNIAIKFGMRLQRASDLFEALTAEVNRRSSFDDDISEYKVKSELILPKLIEDHLNDARLLVVFVLGFIHLIGIPIPTDADLNDQLDV
jgi:hypothetical protein